jgi:hypothetical protein
MEMSCNDFMKALSIQEIVYRVVLYIVLTISLKVVTSSRFHILKLMQHDNSYHPTIQYPFVLHYCSFHIF